MATPYISNRAGSLQWIMQRTSAVLLLGLAGVHFTLQHFTSDAVSTGLTVAARLNNPFWQAFYVVFIVLAMYHGINGVVGIVRDYNPARGARVVLECGLWTMAACFVVLGIKNIVSPVPLGAVKETYAARGFAKGASPGNPPSVLVAYDFRAELGELALMEYYLAHHTHTVVPIDLGAVFEHQGGTVLTLAAAQRSQEQVARSGVAFDRWCQAAIAAGQADPMDRPRSAMFSSTYEFAVWALNVRRANAKLRGDTTTVSRLSDVPHYAAVTLH